ncbi:glycosyltransferase family 4 protein [Pseudoalteromonas fuliginea]|uniref:glycosyltransferase family 4 protein n=1 Tax=Pseudoalteromonas fuliginea TaxID=1872678 RepID=UPI000517EE0A|nr:glycosyltransferase family 4 protein [Pseudoalteromonas fuliginea]KJZ27705.1 polysaccharide biosynthesis protein [Pseudoalteromonas fuliginea]
MLRKNVKNLIISTDYDGQGGIATVVSTYKENGLFERWNIEALSTHSSFAKAGKFSLVLMYAFFIIKLLKTIMFNQVGFAHIHIASRGSYTRKSIVVRILKFFNVKVLLHLHGAEFQDFYQNECSARKKLHIRKTFQMADKVIVLSSQWYKWLSTLLPNNSKLEILYNSVAVPELQRKHVEVGKIVFLGRVGERKGVYDLINAFKLVLDSCPKSQLIIAGDGNLDEAKKLVKNLDIENSIVFTGWVSGEQKKNLLATSDVYCLPSYNEGFPMGILEAMAASIPVVASRVGGIPDAIDNESSGFIIEAGDVGALAGTLTKLINDRVLNQRISTNAKIKFDLEFSLNIIIPKLEKIYKQL